MIREVALPEIAGLSDAYVALGAAVSKRDGIAGRMEDAKRAMAAAVKQRNDLVVKAEAGEAVPAGASRQVEEAIREHESTAGMYAKALVTADTQVAAAAKVPFNILNSVMHSRASAAQAGCDAAKSAYESAREIWIKAGERAQVASRGCNLPESALASLFHAEIEAAKAAASSAKV